MFITATDFNSGKYRISQNPEDIASLNLYITKYEKQYLVNLLGATLYGLFVADLTAGVLPFQTAIYNNLYQPFDEDNLNSSNIFYPVGSFEPDFEDAIDSNFGQIVTSEGIKEMLKGFLFFEFTRDQPFENTPTGNVEQQIENGVKVKALQAGIKEKFNEAVRTYQAIQWYINQNSSSYPDYNGVKMGIIPDFA